MSDNEDKFIAQHEADQVAKIRRERQLEALRQEEREGIASVLHSSEDVANEALELGFDRETARIMHLVPVIQIAWADGEVQRAEREKVLELAQARGIAAGSPASDFLELLLEKRPSDLFFERTNQVIAHLLSDDPTGRETQDLFDHAREVASAAGGFFGLGNKVDEAEQKLIDELVALFSK